ncbi:MAG: hypothetical protein ACREMD_06930 [Gemmatimonadota bacterium]
MRSELLVFGMIAAAIHVVACEGMDPVAPSAIDDGSAVSPSQAPVFVSVAPIGEFPMSGSGISGLATLTRTKESLSVEQDFSGLTEATPIPSGGSSSTALRDVTGAATPAT